MKIILPLFLMIIAAVAFQLADRSIPAKSPPAYAKSAKQLDSASIVEAFEFVSMGGVTVTAKLSECRLEVTEVYSDNCSDGRQLLAVRNIIDVSLLDAIRKAIVHGESLITLSRTNDTDKAFANESFLYCDHSRNTSAVRSGASFFVSSENTGNRIALQLTEYKLNYCGKTY